MSVILDDGPHTVVVYPEVAHLDQRGNAVRRPADVGITVRGCTMTPIRGERGVDGRVRNEYQFMAKDAPLGTWSRVEWLGMTFSVARGPHRFEVSSGTKHVSATLRQER